jgi:hypothetical protein
MVLSSREHGPELMNDRDLTLSEALVSDRLEDFIRQEEARGMEMCKGSEFERALALLTTQRRSKDRTLQTVLEE